jgi:hypothetical protein
MSMKMHGKLWKISYTSSGTLKRFSGSKPYASKVNFLSSEPSGVPEEVYEIFQTTMLKRANEHEDAWKALLENYSKHHMLQKLIFSHLNLVVHHEHH